MTAILTGLGCCAVTLVETAVNPVSATMAAANPAIGPQQTRHRPFHSASSVIMAVGLGGHLRSRLTMMSHGYIPRYACFTRVFEISVSCDPSRTIRPVSKT